MAFKLDYRVQTQKELLPPTGPTAPVKERPSHLFKKGEVANPHGRPPAKHCIPDILKRIGEETCPRDISDKLRVTFPYIGTITTREAWLRVTYLEAIAGEEWASKFIAERTEGKVREVSATNNKGAILAAIDEMLV